MQHKTTHTRSSTASTTGSDNVFILEHTQNKIAALSIQKARLSSLHNRMGNVVLSEAASLFALYLIKVYGYIYNETPNHVLATLAPILPPSLEVTFELIILILKKTNQMRSTPTQENSSYKLITKRIELEGDIQSLETLLLEKLIATGVTLTILIPYILLIVTAPSITFTPISITLTLCAVQHLDALLSAMFIQIKKYIDDRLDNSTYNQLKNLLLDIFPEEMMKEKPKVNDVRRVITFYLSPSSAKNKCLREQLLQLFAAHNITAMAENYMTFEVYINTNKPLPDINKLRSEIKHIITQPPRETVSPRSSNSGTAPSASTSTSTSTSTSAYVNTTENIYNPRRKISPRQNKDTAAAAAAIDNTDRETKTDAASKKVEWVDNNGNTLVYNKSDSHCPIKPITGHGIPENRLFILFPLTVSDFAGNNKALQKFSTLADHVAGAEKRNQGIVFIPDSKKVNPVTCSHGTFFPKAKIKALGDYGDARVYCERLTSANGEQLYVARHYDPHTHKRV